MQPASLFKNISFLAYWLGNASAGLGDALMFIALPYVVFGITGNTDERVLAITLAFGAFPRLFGILIGSLIDRLPLKLSLLLGGLARVTLFTLLSVLLARDVATPTLVYIVAFLNGLFAIFVQTSGNVLVPELVKEEQLARANSLMQLAGKGIPLIGYGLAGLLVATAGTSVTLLIASICFAVLPFTVFLVQFPPQTLNASQSLAQDVFDGISILVKNRILVLASFTALLLNSLVMLLNVLIPGTMQELGWGARGYGLFESAFSAGALLGLTVVGVLLVRIRLTDCIVIALGFGLTSYLAFAVGSSIWFFFGGAFLLGITAGIGSVAVITLFQSTTTVGDRGKVLGGFSSIDALGLTLGPLLTGWLVTVAGDRILYIGCAILIALLTIVFLVSRPLLIAVQEGNVRASAKKPVDVEPTMV